LRFTAIRRASSRVRLFPWVTAWIGYAQTVLPSDPLVAAPISATCVFAEYVMLIWTPVPVVVVNRHMGLWRGNRMVMRMPAHAFVVAAPVYVVPAPLYTAPPVYAAPPVVSGYAAPPVVASSPVYDYAPGYTTTTVITGPGW
jgi:hypothetical protein